MENSLADRLAVLGHPQRLAVFRLLIRRYPDQVAAGDIATALDLRPSTLSSYLAALLQAGLIEQTRESTWLRYSINVQDVRKTFDALFLDCCRGRPQLCSPLAFTPKQSPANMTDSKFNVLFICTGNSARSIFAESILRAHAGDRFNAYSAGTRPYSVLNDVALEVLRSKGHDVSPLRAKNLDQFRGPDAPQFDFVFTVCDQAANEDCPAWEGQPISAHWGMPDPVKAGGTDAQKSLAFQQAYGILKNRIAAFSALPLRELDRISLQRAIDDIARTPETAK
ncbi:arsenate reductase/protein-tyrosine-phosphatase family protein [Sedimentitalea nanhaiensis]|uniref:Transcriptional regulator, ArsR family n=1 Tax=Sedimentitalea nanhaiensis TaxID=999627 RepID=A0A1I7BHF6_9RHOB|nr:helix-turn-helix domain-containing protein [Sedimentitalea nanhaiensis]SFT86593.1 transcriptional regulator, ArsR family [Sedimentitalea nanhaiensis]